MVLLVSMRAPARAPARARQDLRRPNAQLVPSLGSQLRHHHHRALKRTAYLVCITLVSSQPFLIRNPLLGKSARDVHDEDGTYGLPDAEGRASEGFPGRSEPPQADLPWYRSASDVPANGPSPTSPQRHPISPPLCLRFGVYALHLTPVSDLVQSSTVAKVFKPESDSSQEVLPCAGPSPCSFAPPLKPDNVLLSAQLKALIDQALIEQGFRGRPSLAFPLVTIALDLQQQPPHCNRLSSELCSHPSSSAACHQAPLPSFPDDPLAFRSPAFDALLCAFLPAIWINVF